MNALTKWPIYTILILVLLLLASCTVPAPPTISPTSLSSGDTATQSSGTEDMLEPGDMVGEMQFNIAPEWDWDRNFHGLCDQDNIKEVGRMHRVRLHGMDRILVYFQLRRRSWRFTGRIGRRVSQIQRRYALRRSAHQCACFRLHRFT